MDNACRRLLEVRHRFRRHGARQQGDALRGNSFVSCRSRSPRAAAGPRVWHWGFGRSAMLKRVLGAMAAMTTMAATAAVAPPMAGPGGDGVRPTIERSDASARHVSNEDAPCPRVTPMHAARLDASLLGQQLRALEAPTFAAQTLPAGVLSSAPAVSRTAPGPARSASNDNIDFSGADARALRWRIEPLRRGVRGIQNAFPDPASPWYAHRCTGYVEGSRIENINRMADGGEPYVACKPR